MALPPREFDPCGELPRGVTVLEASAGTGKTWTIAALAARYVAEGTPLDRLLLVTFTRIATGELRERVRDRLVSVERGLARVLAGAELAAEADPVVRLLGADAQAAPQRRACLERAIAGFDAATIATTHGFCQEVLSGLGITGDLEPDVAFVEDISDLVDEVVDDLYIRRFRKEGSPPFKRAEAARIARLAIENPSDEIVSSDAPVPKLRAGLAQAARDELERRKRAMAVMTYDDLVTRLRAALAGPRGPATAAQLRTRFDVVLVDEFQDTDPAQWEIMQLAFGETGATLVLIADPKQAIYAFRGADVYAYLDAARAAGSQATLGVNRRSDQGLIDAHDALFTGVNLGHAGIPYRQVRAAPGHEASRLHGAPVGEPLRFRVVMREDPALSLTQGGFARNASARELIAADVAGDIVRLLSSDATVAGQDGPERVRPAHLAVLVRTNRQAALVRDALGDAGVPAVINGAGSVFDTDGARQWLRLLEALERPASIARARSAALTAFVGWDAARLAGAAGDEESPAWEEVHRRLHDWARILRTRGVASLLEAMTIDPGSDSGALAARLLAEESGERALTDLRHIGQLLHAAASAEQLGPTALTAWLRTRIAEAQTDTADEERSRRLESDAEAVQVLTIHRSKGLEFPIVYLPYLWEPGFIPKEAQPVFFHDPTAADARRIDVAMEGSDYAAHRAQNVTEQRGEDLRLMYVGLTRARHQAIVWWAGSWDSRNSPLARLLFNRSDNGDIAGSGASTPSDQAILARLSTVAERAPGEVTVERAAVGTPGTWSPPAAPQDELGVSVFDRRLDLRWRRTSYSDMTAASHEAWVTSEPEEPLLADEPPAESPAPEGTPTDDPSLPLTLETDAAHVPSLLATMPPGVDVGTFVHLVMEATDFAAPDLGAELAARIADVQARRAIDVGSVATLAAGLAAVIETPLGPVLGNLRLRDIARADRLDELGFELPLAGGEEPSGGWVTPEAIAGVLRRHLRRGDPLLAYADRLRDARLRQSVRGFLTGSLDLVARIGHGDDARYAIVDYKTNWLAGPDEELTIHHYRPPAITAEMLRHHYALQALLYAVALHRFLRWRLPGYDPARHLAGVGYLFVRGMAGAGTPVVDGAPYGVFGWKPPRGLVPALSDALDDVAGGMADGAGTGS